MNRRAAVAFGAALALAAVTAMLLLVSDGGSPAASGAPRILVAVRDHPTVTDSDGRTSSLGPAVLRILSDFDPGGFVVRGAGEPLLMAWSPDGRRLATWEAFYDAAGDSLRVVMRIYSLPFFRGPTIELLIEEFPSGMHWSPDSTILAVPLRDRVRFYSVDGTIILESDEAAAPDADSFGGALWSPDGALITLRLGEAVVIIDRQGRSAVLDGVAAGVVARNDTINPIMWTAVNRLLVIDGSGTNEFGQSAYEVSLAVSAQTWRRLSPEEVEAVFRPLFDPPERAAAIAAGAKDPSPVGRTADGRGWIFRERSERNQPQRFWVVVAGAKTNSLLVPVAEVSPRGGGVDFVVIDFQPTGR